MLPSYDIPKHGLSDRRERSERLERSLNFRSKISVFDNKTIFLSNLSLGREERLSGHSGRRSIAIIAVSCRGYRDRPKYRGSVQQHLSPVPVGPRNHLLHFHSFLSDR
jgi:hypothetical protein